MVASNLFGDIPPDLGPACIRTIAIAPSGNINPEGRSPSLFELVHVSGPHTASKVIANPVGQIWVGEMMLVHLGFKDVGDAIVAAIEVVLAEKDLRAGDLGGSADTMTCGTAIADGAR